mmetsp:Transcript_60895/g.89289  ORF Transcript_60895/g.89289 Transcript_60895/m.89289 type:complete len:131 (-) Transcript_60895:116-508(-)
MYIVHSSHAEHQLCLSSTAIAFVFNVAMSVLRYLCCEFSSTCSSNTSTIGCNTLQHAATRWNTLYHTAPQCSTLHHTATRCNSLQQSATQISQVCVVSAPERAPAQVAVFWCRVAIQWGDALASQAGVCS